MSNISDIIEEFILSQLESDNSVNVSRNEMASFFNVAPSQINYVLSTRFTSPRGYIIESRRGGGGYIKIEKVNMGKSKYINHIYTNLIADELDYSTAESIINSLVDKNIIDDRERLIILSAICSKSLATPLKIDGRLRANILKNILLNLMKEVK